MISNLLKSKDRAKADQPNQDGLVARDDYGMTAAPETMLEPMRAIERHRLVNAEGCKPEIGILLFSMHCGGSAVRRDLKQTEGVQPDSYLLFFSVSADEGLPVQKLDNPVRSIPQSSTADRLLETTQ